MKIDESKKKKVIKHISAGCLVIRKLNNQPEIILLHCRWDDGTSGWVPPKGHVEKDEDLETAALREVAEETGYTDVEIVKYMKQVDIKFKTSDGQKHSKEIHWFLADLKSERKHKYQRTDYEDKNILDMRWIPINEAVDLIPFKEEKELVRSLQDE